MHYLKQFADDRCEVFDMSVDERLLAMLTNRPCEGDVSADEHSLPQFDNYS